ncbi:hypothetical protein BHM03_00042071 [Ensete ventricosum]|nr:hypothetical protein BHM03_00042071 [Ensete ventricosum]
MFWWEREKETGSREHNGGPPCGQVRVLVVGDAGIGLLFDKESVIKFFRMLIRRRYFSDELPGPSPWSTTPLQNSLHLTSENSSDENQLHRRLSSLSGEGYKSSVLPPLPAQLNLAPPPTLYPQQPMSVPESYSFHRFTTSGLSEMGSTKSSRADINV